MSLHLQRNQQCTAKPKHVLWCLCVLYRVPFRHRAVNFMMDKLCGAIPVQGFEASVEILRWEWEQSWHLLASSGAGSSSCWRVTLTWHRSIISFQFRTIANAIWFIALCLSNRDKFAAKINKQIIPLCFPFGITRDEETSLNALA